MPEQTIAERIASFAHETSYAGLDEDVRGSVRQRILDILGICVAARALDTSQAAVDYVRSLGGDPQAHAVGVEGRVTAEQAAFLNGVFAHSLDYDDTHLPSVLHPSASVVPASIAAAELAGASEHDLIRAIAVGLEVTVRLGMAGYQEASGNSLFFEHGQHATATCGAMGSTVAAGMLLGFGPEELVHTLGVTGSMAAGILEANRSGGTVKRLHCGWAAKAALASASLVRSGFTGPATVFEGRFGFFEAFLHGSELELDTITEGLGKEWSVAGINFKPYPANHFTHTSIDAGTRLRARGLDPAQITRIELGVPAPALRTIGEPIEIKRAPATGYQAQFSGPYCFVAGLLGGSGLGVAQSDFAADLVTDPERVRLMAMVSVVPNAECSSIFPYEFPVIAEVETKDGRVWREEVMTTRGGATRPLTDEELLLKFRTNAAVSDADASPSPGSATR